MSVIFIRHAALEQPYDNYEKLSLEQLDQLATEKVQPSINPVLARQKINQHIADGFFGRTKVDSVYHSPAPRARQTAELIAETIGVGEIKELDCLREILFSPRRLVTSVNFEQRGMTAVRDAVYGAIEHDTASETRQSIHARIRQVQTLIADHNDRTIVVVTHGFFMRLLQIVLFGERASFTIAAQERAINYSNLEGFVYDKSKGDPHRK